MSDVRPWVASYPPDVPTTLAPFPEESVFTLLESSAGRFPDRPAIAWFGKHLSYADLLAEVERCAAMLAGLGVQEGRPRGADRAELPGLHDRLLRLHAARCDRRVQQPVVHGARDAPPAGRRRAGRGHRGRPDVRGLRAGVRRSRDPARGRDASERLHAIHQEAVGAGAEVQEGAARRGQAMAPGPEGRAGAPMAQDALGRRRRAAGRDDPAGRRCRRADLHWRDDRHREGRDAVASQPVRERAAGRRLVPDGGRGRGGVVGGDAVLPLVTGCSR